MGQDFDISIPSEYLAMLFDAQEFIQQMYSKELLHEKFPNYPRITLFLMLQALGVLHSVCKLLNEQIQVEFDKISFDEAIKSCPIIPIKQLQDALRTALCIDHKTAKQVIQFLTYSGSLSQEIWNSPLIALNERYLIPILSAVLAPNLVRMAEKWMQSGGVKLEQKGHFFEKQVREQLRSAINSSKILKNVGICPHAIPSKDIGEQIDIVLWIRNKIFIGEIKCVLFPANSIEIHNYYETLNQAANQVKRKVEVVRQNKEGLLSKLEIGYEIASEVLFIPFVLTNLSLGVGYCFNDVPVVDVIILRKYFAEGKFTYERFGGEGDGRFESYKLETVASYDLYQTETEAYDRIEMYLQEPTYVKLYKDFLKPRHFRQPPIMQGDKPVFVTLWDVHLPSLRDQKEGAHTKSSHQKVIWTTPFSTVYKLFYRLLNSILYRKNTS